MTTNSEDGVVDYRALAPVFARMEEVGLPLSLHGEKPDTPLLNSEIAFLDAFIWIVENFPRLKVIFEHVSTAEAVAVVADMPEGRIAATITLHHLLLTYSDVFGRNHHFCKPVANTRASCDALIAHAISGDSHFFFGSDSAPHPIGDKECAKAKAGIFSAPVAIPALWQFFVEELGGVEAALGPFQSFTARNGAAFYGLSTNTDIIRLVRKSWTVPEVISGSDQYVPFLAGQELEWQVKTD